jgi:hypothetical protein
LQAAQQSNWLGAADRQQLDAAEEVILLWPAHALVNSAEHVRLVHEDASSSVSVTCFMCHSCPPRTPVHTLLLLLLCFLLLCFLLLLPFQDQYQAVTAEMYVDGAGMRSGGGGAGGFRQGCGTAYGDGGACGYDSQGEFSNGACGMDPAAGGGAGNGYDAGPSNVLWLHGLPLSAQEEDIVRWFEDCQVVTPLLPDK